MELVKNNGKNAIKGKQGYQPTVFTLEVAEDIVSAAAEGLPLTSCAALAGVSKHTVNDWMQKGEEGHERYVDFAMAVRKAQAEYKLELIRKVKDIGVSTNQWAALMTILERVYGDEFRRPTEKQDITVNVGILEKRVHELAAQGEVVYDGG